MRLGLIIEALCNAMSVMMAHRDVEWEVVVTNQLGVVAKLRVWTTAPSGRPIQKWETNVSARYFMGCSERQGSEVARRIIERLIYRMAEPEGSPLTGLQKWVRESREQQRRAPERYLASYPELVLDDKYVLMTPELREKIERNCGRYDGTLPTGTYLGKMFMRERSLCWIGISKDHPETHISWNAREILEVT